MADDAGLLGQVRRKLVETKQRWAREGRLLTGRTGEEVEGAGARGAGAERLPPGQKLVRDWPVLDLGIQPDIARAAWRLGVDGLVENPIDWDWAAFKAQPRFQSISDIHCVTAWSRYDNRWEGVSARHLLALVRPRPEARHIVFHSHDGYTTNLEVAAFDDEDVLLADTHDGKPILRSHGGPVRVVVPKRYFWKSAKWVQRIELTDRDQPGFWEVRGYHNEGDPWREERYGV